MGSSLQNDHEMKDGVMVQLKNDVMVIKNSEMVENVGTDGFDLETESDFCPIQHPTEPSREDKPVQCPMPHSSHLINDERVQGGRFSERKRPEALTVVHKESESGAFAFEPMGPPIRTYRKRHHDHTNTVTPLLHSHQDINAIVFNKFEQVQRFGS